MKLTFRLATLLTFLLSISISSSSEQHPVLISYDKKCSECYKKAKKIQDLLITQYEIPKILINIRTIEDNLLDPPEMIRPILHFWINKKGQILVPQYNFKEIQNSLWVFSNR